MSRFVCFLFGLGMLGLTVASQPTLAQPKETKETTKTADTQLTAETLKAILDGLGYEIESDNKDKDGKAYGYNITLPTGKYTCHPSVSLSTDSTNLWFTINLAKIPDPGSVPTKVLLNLLAANDRIFPSYFYYVESNNTIYITSYMANKNLKPKDLKQRLESMSTHVNNNDMFWNPGKWEKTKTKE